MIRTRQKVWRKSPRIAGPVIPDAAEKLSIIAACETFIRDVLKPRFLPEIKPEESNYIIDLHGQWAAGRYRFMRRLRSGFPHNRGFEFDMPFARIDRVGQDLFDVYWMRHTGSWRPLHAGKSLAEALRIIETDDVIRPVW